MRILCVGASHKTAAVSMRERLSFDCAKASLALAQLAQRWPAAEFLLLSTCNRVELYVARPLHERPRVQDLVDWLGEFHRVHPDSFAGETYSLADAQAVAHLLRVTAGLDSLVPGEDQIVAQVKEACRLADEARAARGVMKELVEGALHTAKHVRTETGVAAGKVSVASVAVDLIRQGRPALEQACVLSIGAGEMSAMMLKHMAKLGCRKILIANRSPDRAAALARLCGGTSVSLEDLDEHLAAADIVVTSTGSPQPLVTAAMVEAAQHRRGGKSLLIVDIAVPRDVDPAAAGVHNVSLFNIDDLEQTVRRTIALRQDEQDRACDIIDRHVAELTERLHVRKVSPTIDALYKRLEQIAAEELASARNKLSTHADAADDEEVIQRALHRAVRRILHDPATRLRQDPDSARTQELMDAVRELFALGKDLTAENAENAEN
ncbi:MAG: glutamyl-tRNA reductase [Planctomycetaceae bacterium]|nr:glutamyl-tRNA reductase [Planctomycetaceae bacterium]